MHRNRGTSPSRPRQTILPHRYLSPEGKLLIVYDLADNALPFEVAFYALDTRGGPRAKNQCHILDVGRCEERLEFGCGPSSRVVFLDFIDDAPVSYMDIGDVSAPPGTVEGRRLLMSPKLGCDVISKPLMPLPDATDNVVM